MRKSCSQGTRMHKLQQSAPASTNAPTKPLGMDEDKDLEDAMLSMSPVKLHMQSFTVPAAAGWHYANCPKDSTTKVPSAALSIPLSSTTAEPQASSADGAASSVKRKSPAPLPQELAFLLKETTGPSTDAASTSVCKVLTFEDSSEDDPSAQPAVPVPVAGYEYDLSSWNCSPHQQLWMKTELQDLGLWPGSRPVRHAGNATSLWRLPPQPELIDTVADLPSPNFFQLHPFFSLLLQPESVSAIMVRLRNNYILPCLHDCFGSQVVSAGVGRPRVIVGTSGQYYILSSRLCCRACRRNWFADNPRWLEKLPKRFTNLLPAFLTYKKAICKSVMDEPRRTGKSPADMANQLNELMHLKYERAHLAYLHATESVWDSEAGAHGQRTIGKFLRKENKPQEFRSYEDPHAWCGVSVSSHYLTDCLLDEFRRQHPVISKLLQATSSGLTTPGRWHEMSRWHLGSCPVIT
ncbi:uncharacterized protein LOC120720565 [Simochromis diagramma]|uniref:uncharacterized protein LOC120720565 n=1 Tax=Simochromis diagramma TaxID=43689 RepID=UPI001A7E7ADD|nr:uncharacterized protein LOC120720565 [Simochromis diagramma]